MVHLFPSWLVLGRSQVYFACRSAQTTHKIVLAGSAKEPTGAKSLLSWYIYCGGRHALHTICLLLLWICEYWIGNYCILRIYSLFTFTTLNLWILKGNCCILWIEIMPGLQKLGKKVFHKLKWSKMFSSTRVVKWKHFIERFFTLEINFDCQILALFVNYVNSKK